ncbi:hypothetical protein LTR10_011498 [Elasticomyces elasticus]|uniref:NADH:flavin oxidoreductase/NADH oxidase N-terminal domain-containing protein n=1 Tax=Exophiala sideris TaxID=1016849 RepID=A0ABR0JCM4_9EURO|nr:hypothetical protein LTR10_011498 [Elasticomyces elasticus]KAK5032045.1 hypothetical protein LTS07_004667 [Exophiala sideris]KAK5040973.1 hypothetical protein LTR13_003275 [Exophiala sideris]KAK5061693.1 hypothetical protein LTR69_004875 [Exophiala sideris]KAK5184393.1 hypothetical protein LTR44_003066 [Eurotiomycetes sp. CCFEE 6388]
MSKTPSIDTLIQTLTLPSGLSLPNRLVKCPMQETCAELPYYDPPIEKFRNLYGDWADSRYGMLITGQVQVDRRFLSLPGDVCCHEDSLSAPVLAQWKEWAQVAQQGGTPCVVQIGHPGRMSPAGTGIRPADMSPLAPSSVPVKMGDTWFDKLVQDKLLGTPKEMTHAEIDEAVANFVRAARVAHTAGFAGIQLHGAHGFLISQFLSPYTNRRTDDYGGTPGRRLRFLQRLIEEIRAVCPPPFCVGVKLNSGDYMDKAGLTQEEALEQVRWLVDCEMVDFVEISGGIAESTSCKLHDTFGHYTVTKAPKQESTRLREAFFTEFAEKVQGLRSKVPIQLSGGFRSRNGMADAIDSGACQLIGLGRTAVLQPSLPKDILLNTAIPDDVALAMPHEVEGMWLADMMPSKIVGAGLAGQVFYWNMRRLGSGLSGDPYASISWVLFSDALGALKGTMSGVSQSILERLRSLLTWQREKTD